ncbi:major capsid protein [Trinickia sp. YCB016]
MKMMKRAAAAVKRNGFAVATGAAALVASTSVFAQTSGTTGTINDAPIVSSITGVTSNVQDIGAAVLAVVVCAWGYRVVKGFLGR